MALLELPLEVLTGVCEQLDLRDLLRTAATCTRFRHGDGGPETELRLTSPVVVALGKQAFPHVGLIPSTRSLGCLESWVAYLARCTRQRRWQEAPLISAGYSHSLFVE
jgi:hypothetical protein